MISQRLSKSQPKDCNKKFHLTPLLSRDRENLAGLESLPTPGLVWSLNRSTTPFSPFLNAFSLLLSSSLSFFHIFPVALDPKSFHSVCSCFTLPFLLWLPTSSPSSLCSSHVCAYSSSDSSFLPCIPFHPLIPPVSCDMCRDQANTRWGDLSFLHRISHISACLLASLNCCWAHRTP